MPHDCDLKHTLCAVVAYDTRGHGKRLSIVVTLTSLVVGRDARLALIVSPLVYICHVAPMPYDIMDTSLGHPDVR